MKIKTLTKVLLENFDPDKAKVTTISGNADAEVTKHLGSEPTIREPREATLTITITAPLDQVNAALDHLRVVQHEGPAVRAQ